MLRHHLLKILVGAAIVGANAGAQEGDTLLIEEEISIFDSIFEIPEENTPVELCKDLVINNPGFGFGAQDFNTGCPDQIILQNTGLNPEAYERTDVRIEPAQAKGAVLLRALDKLTGRLTDIEVPTGGEAHFETLQVRVAACYKNPESETPESAAFLQISGSASSYK